MSEELFQIIRQCSNRDRYDDNGYCEHKIKKYEPYYTKVVKDGHCDTHCAECMLQVIIHDKERDFTYQDDWFTEHKMFTDTEKIIREKNK